MTDRSPEFLRGARAALACLNRIQDFAASRAAAETFGEWEAAQTFALAVLHRQVTDVAGPLPAFAVGFLELISEYLADALEGTQPELERWRPETLMSDPDLALAREKIREQLYNEDLG